MPSPGNPTSWRSRGTMMGGQMLVIDCLFDGCRAEGGTTIDSPHEQGRGPESIRVRVRQLRTERGWSQEAFADLAAFIAPTSGDRAGRAEHQPGEHPEARRHPGHLAGRVVLDVRREAVATSLTHHRRRRCPRLPHPAEVVALGFRAHVATPPTCRMPRMTLGSGVRPVFRTIGSGRNLILRGRS